MLLGKFKNSVVALEPPEVRMKARVDDNGRAQSTSPPPPAATGTAEFMPDNMI